jgi:hypothetical protein
MPDERKYWFAAKRYGWGWGLPSTWQGWLVVAVYFALVGTGYFVLRPNTPDLYAICVCIFSALPFAICWLKGEPPTWRWGGK